MKIVHLLTHVSTTGETGGVQRVAIESASLMRSRGHEVRIVGGWKGLGPPPREVEGVPLQTFPVSSLIGRDDQRLLLPRKLLFGIATAFGRDELIHIHLCRDFVTTPTALHLHRRRHPYIAQSHGMLRAQTRLHRTFDRLLTGPAVRGASAAVALTELESQGLRQLGVSDRRIAHVPNAVSVDEANPWIGAESDYILFAGRLSPRKQPGLLVRALHDLRELWPGRVLFVGPDEGEWSQVQTLAQDLGLRDRIEWLGPIEHDEVLRLLRSARAFVLPSIQEPFPMAALEALASGVPSVITEDSGITDVLLRRDAAITVRPTREGVSEGLRLLLKSDAPELSRKAHQAAVVEFSGARSAKLLEEVYVSAVV